MVSFTFNVAASGQEQEWPRFLGPRSDVSRQGPPLARKFPPGGPVISWRRPIHGGYSGITLSGGRLYTMDRPSEPAQSERVLCLDAATGKLLWEFVYPANYGDLTYESGPRASVTIHEGLAYTLGAVGHIHCLKAETGAAVWSTPAIGKLNAKRPEWGFAASPFIHGEVAIFQVGARPGGFLVALDRLRGHEVWRAGSDPAGYSTPILTHQAGGAKLICWGPEHLYSLDPGTGEIFWKYPYPIQYGVSLHSPLAADGFVLVSSYWHGVRAIRLGAEAREFSLAWSTDAKMLCGIMSTPLYRQGHVYMLDKQYGLTCFELAGGKKIWDDAHRATPADRNPQASLVWAGHEDQALILNAQGQLILARLNPDGYQEDDRAQMIGKTWAYPAYDAGHAYARSDQEIVCLELPLDGKRSQGPFPIK